MYDTICADPNDCSQRVVLLVWNTNTFVAMEKNVNTFVASPMPRVLCQGSSFVDDEVNEAHVERGQPRPVIFFACGAQVSWWNAQCGTNFIVCTICKALGGVNLYAYGE